MKLSRHVLYSALLALGGCAVDAAAPSAPSVDDPSNLLPDGATGVDRVVRHGETIAVPWTAQRGMKYVEDDFAIGPALAKVLELATPDSIGEWPGNVVPFCIVDIADNAAEGIAAADQTRLVNMLKELERITPLDFQRFGCKDASKPASYVDYRYWDTTTSNETIGGINHSGWTIQLVRGFHNPDVWHETGHALGYMHEQKRQDRASFVNYYPGCVTPSNMTSQYTQIASTELTPYDIDSIMQYSSYSFATYDASNNIVCPPLLFGGSDPSSATVWGHFNGTTLRGSLIGQSQQWSLEDINGAYTWYEPRLGTAEQNDMLGTAMVAGDFDGDGYDDLAVGAMGEQPFSGHGGAVFLYKGTMNGLVAWMILDEAQFAGTATHSNDDFGIALAAGDLDGDGITDLAVGAPLYGSPQGGAVFVFKGGRGGPVPMGAPITEATLGSGNVESGDMFGNALAIGKLAGGSKRYLAIGAPWEIPGSASGSRGMVSIAGWSGSAFTLWDNLNAGDEGIAINGGMFGYALAAGDLNEDGIDDLMVGAPAVGVGHGNVAAYFGHSGAMTIGAPLAIEVGTLQTGDRFGYSLAYRMSDTGNEALAVGAPGRAGPGRAFMFEPFNVGNPGTWQILEHMEYQQNMIPGEGGQTGDNFGAAVALADIDGDGNLDVLVGAPGKPIAGLTAAGEVAIFSTHNAPKVIVPTSPNAQDNFGSSIAIGNFDRGAQSVVHNGQPDLAIGIPSRAVGSVANAGVFNTYKGFSQAFWRQFNESTHNGP